MICASAPGKIVLMGEHAVVFGKPAIALSVDLRTDCLIQDSTEMLVNGLPITAESNPYLDYIVNDVYLNNPTFPEHKPLEFVLTSDIPAGSGLGSSAALCAASLGAISKMNNIDWDREAIAKKSFEVEFNVQGRASPMDTSVCTYGGGIFLDSKHGPNFMWEARRNDKSWYIHNLNVPQMKMVIGYTGVKKPTGPMISKVAAYCKKTKFACELIDEIGDLTLEGAETVKKNDLEYLGRLMTKNHKLLTILGVSSPELQKLVDAALPYSYGAKLTGAGGGGSMIALTDNPEKVCKAIEMHGGLPYAVNTCCDGLKIYERENPA